MQKVRNGENGAHRHPKSKHPQNAVEKYDDDDDNVFDYEDEDDTADLYNFDSDDEDGVDAQDRRRRRGGDSVDDDPSSSYASWRAAHRRRRRYRQFSTSISSMFHDPADCLALVCCGVLLSDHTHHLLTEGRSRPPSWARRFVSHVAAPAALAGASWICRAVRRRSDDEDEDDGAAAALETTGRVLLFLACAYVAADLVDVMDGRRDARRAIARRGARASAREDDVADATASVARDRCAACQAHNLLLCGCYPRDDLVAGSSSSSSRRRDFAALADEEDEDDGPVAELVRRHDLCTRAYRVFSALCCGALCRCWCQCCGACAIAQEAREIKRLVPPEDRMVDLVTLQPYADYWPENLRLRTERVDSLAAHARALSDLSRGLCRAWGTAVLAALLFVAATKAIAPRWSSHPFEQWLVLLATFFQAFSFLFAVYWLRNRRVVSLDAVVKYFFSGFVLSTGITFLFDAIVSFVGYALIAALVARDGGYDVAHETYGEDTADGRLREELAEIRWRHEHVLLVLFSYFVESFVLAAVVEEACKYYSYAMVSHPDLEDPAVVAKAIAKARRRDNGDGGDVELASVPSSSSSSSLRGRRRRRDVHDDPSSSSSPEDVGVRVTVVMVAVALGFACNENILYVFASAKDGGGVVGELTTLVHRALVPVHPIAAAIQSVGVCRRDLERRPRRRGDGHDDDVGLGRILGPSVVFHGSFDFLLMAIPFLLLVGLTEEYADFLLRRAASGDDAVMHPALREAFDNANTFTSTAAFAVATAGVVYYLLQSSSQKERLATEDRASRAVSLSRLL